MGTKIDTALLGPKTLNGLACPFAKADPEKYKTHLCCRPENGWPNVKDIAEHIWRFHSPLYRCEFCGYRWTGVSNRSAVQSKRIKHIPKCKAEKEGVLQPADLDILSQEQQSAFEKTKNVRDNEKKFAALYEACGWTTEPETYHVKPLLAPNQIPTNNSSGFWDGFPRTTYTGSWLNGAEQQPAQPSSADNTHTDPDSAYGSGELDFEYREPKPRMSPCSWTLWGNQHQEVHPVPLRHMGARFEVQVPQPPGMYDRISKEAGDELSKMLVSYETGADHDC